MALHALRDTLKRATARAASVIFVVLGLASLVGLTAINTQCGDLGPGIHQWNGLTITCS